MKKILVTALLLALSGHAAADEKLKRFIGHVDGDITVGADGTVKAVALNNIKDAGLRAFLVSQVKTWEFYPMTVDGQAQDMSSAFSFIVVAAFDAGKKLQEIVIDDVFIAPNPLEASLRKEGPESVRKHSPNYPSDALSMGAEARVKVAVQISPDGKVSNAAIHKLALLNAGHRDDLRARAFAEKSFGAAALAAVRRWQWSPEWAAKCDNPCEGVITVDFTVPAVDGWRSYSEFPVQPAAWLMAADIKEIDQKQRSEFVRLKDDPSGKIINTGS